MWSGRWRNRPNPDPAVRPELSPKFEEADIDRRLTDMEEEAQSIMDNTGASRQEAIATVIQIELLAFNPNTELAY
jgi:hypothetical protein